MFEAKIKQVAELRVTLDGLLHEKEKLELELAKTPQGQRIADIDGSVKDLKAVLDTVIIALKEEAQEYARQTGDVKPAKGLTIRRTTKLHYDPAEAIRWARTTKPEMVDMQLRKREFDKFARTTNLPFVKMVEELEARLASDLTEVK